MEIRPTDEEIRFLLIKYAKRLTSAEHMTAPSILDNIKRMLQLAGELRE